MSKVKELSELLNNKEIYNLKFKLIVTKENLFRVFDNQDSVGLIALSNYTLIPGENLPIKSIVINQQKNGYATRILSIIKQYAEAFKYETMSMEGLLHNGYGLTLNDRIEIFHKIGNRIGAKPITVYKHNEYYVVYTLSIYIQNQLTPQKN